MTAHGKVYLAVDMGASGGRVVAGLLGGKRLELEEMHRFENGGIAAGGHLYWDILGQWSQVKTGLGMSAVKFGDRVASVGVDTWGVDFGLLGRGDELLGNPYHYRDRRTSGILERAFALVPREEIFAETGLQFMEFNTLYQLLAMRFANSPLLEAAETLLLIPDLMHWLLTGEKANELTDATTTQFYNPQTNGWSTTLFDRFGLPQRLLGTIVQPGTRLGKLRPHVIKETGLKTAEVVVPGTHDTASAVMAVPAASKPGQTPDWCYISSGTWSLLGVEVPRPVVTEACRRRNFTNEGGVGGTTRLLKNIAGLWLVQECRRVWKQANRYFGWDELVQMATATRPLVSLIDPDHESFVAPPDMPQAIRDFCRATNQPVPQSEGEVIRCALESLALRYRLVLGWLEELLGSKINTVHIVGGGAQNKLLCQMAANSTNRRVVAGPVEATAIGNVMLQAVTSGAVGSIAEAREVIRASFDVAEYSPRETSAWDEAYGRFQGLATKA